MPGQRGPVPVPLEAGNGTRDLTLEILEHLDEKENWNTSDDFPSISQAQIKAALDRLASRQMLEYDTKDAEILVLTDEAKQICEEGSHEYKVWQAVKSKGKIAVKDLAVRC